MLYSRFSLLIYFRPSINSVYMSVLISQFIPPLLPHFDVHTFVLYVCASVSHLLNPKHVFGSPTLL